MMIFPPFSSSSLTALMVIFSGSSFPNPFFVNEVRRYFSRASFELDINSRSQTSLRQIRDTGAFLFGQRLTCENTGYRVKCEWSVRYLRVTITYLLITILRRRVTSLYTRCCASEKCLQCTETGGVYLVVELGLLGIIRVLCGDGRKESEAQQEQRGEYPHRVQDQQ